MARSQRYRELVKRTNELRRNLLPRVLSPTGQYNSRQYDRARAYRLLVHSEIEAYIEDRVKAISLEAMRQWQTVRKLNQVTVALLAFSDLKFDSPPETLNPTRGNRVVPSTSDRLVAANNRFLHEVRSNHGIKEKNLLQLLFPIGVQEQDLDITWISSMDSFGTQRGEIAHTSFKTQQLIDPASEIATVNNLLDGLKGLDEILNELLKFK